MHGLAGTAARFVLILNDMLKSSRNSFRGGEKIIKLSLEVEVLREKADILVLNIVDVDGIP